MELERENPHWNDGFFYPFEKKRFLFEEIRKSSFSGLITAVYGLRRVGKSVLLKQLANDEIRRKTKREDVFYYSFDEKTDDFWEVVNAYERRRGKKIGKETCVFFDEVQKVEDWRAKVKKLYDSCGPKIVLSGSNSALIRRGGESLAGRINEFTLPELSFREFLFFKGKTSLESPMLEESLEKAFWEYLKKPFPELVENDSLDPEAYVETIARKIIFEDLPQAFPIDEPNLLHRLFSLICANPGATLEYTSLATDLQRNRKTISAYVDFLLYGFLARRLYNYSENALTSEKKMKKIYPSLACFAKTDEPHLVETAMAQAIKPKFFWNHKNRYETDFAVENPFYAFEVKYREKLSPADFKGLEQFKHNYPNAKTAMISKTRSQNTVPYYAIERFLEQHQIKPQQA